MNPIKKTLNPKTYTRKPQTLSADSCLIPYHHKELRIVLHDKETGQETGADMAKEGSVQKRDSWFLFSFY